ncbi:MAG: class I SAM-dependent methyltransferase [Caulobacterales bacterium]|nr:class I SAM-dependent methyltransferase [Caulobacterales bacterium]
MKLDWLNPQLTPSSLSEAGREAFDVGAFFPFTLNAYSMVHYAPVIERILAGLSVRRIVEVGVFQGDLSVYILDLARKANAAADFVDIAFKPEVRARIAQAAGDTPVCFHECASVDALGAIDPMDFVFLDGDHNYETVEQELALIAAAAGKRIVLMHDVGWPWGRRDGAYAPARLADPDAYKAGELTPFSDRIVEEFGLPFQPVKLREGGPRNGVLTAAEDFRAARGARWRYWSIPLFFGLGVLWDGEAVTVEEDMHLLEIGRAMQAAAPLMASAELNRLMMLIKLQSAGVIWKRQRERIIELESRLAASQAKVNNVV